MDCGRTPRKGLAGSESRQYKAGEAILSSVTKPHPCGDKWANIFCQILHQNPRKKELPVLEAHLWYDQTDCLLFAPTVPWWNGCWAAQYELVCGSECSRYGDGGVCPTDPYSDQMASAGVQVVLLHQSSPSSLSLPIWPFANHDKNVSAAHFYFNLLYHNMLWLPLSNPHFSLFLFACII